MRLQTKKKRKTTDSQIATAMCRSVALLNPISSWQLIRTCQLLPVESDFTNNKGNSTYVSNIRMGVAVLHFWTQSFINRSTKTWYSQTVPESSLPTTSSQSKMKLESQKTQWNLFTTCESVMLISPGRRASTWTTSANSWSLQSSEATITNFCTVVITL